jgi:hypothetical protein
MSEKLRLPSAGRSADDYHRLRDAIQVCLSADVKRIERGGQRELDRCRLRLAFDESGFADEYFGLDFGAPLEQFLPALEHVHRQVLSGYEHLARQYPNGEWELDLSRLR